MDLALGRTKDVRFIGSLIGRYVLASRYALVAGAPQILTCRLQSISPHVFIATAPIAGRKREIITANFGPFGTIRGEIGRHIEGGFYVEIDCEADHREKLASRIDWYKKRTFAGVTDKREHRRLMPRDPRSVVVLSNGAILPCLIIDMSISGVAVSSDFEPMLGEPLAVGKVVGRVVRKLEVGFAVQFLATQPLADLEELLHPLGHVPLEGVV